MLSPSCPPYLPLQAGLVVCCSSSSPCFYWKATWGRLCNADRLQNLFPHFSLLPRSAFRVTTVVSRFSTCLFIIRRLLFGADYFGGSPQLGSAKTFQDFVCHWKTVVFIRRLRNLACLFSCCASMLWLEQTEWFLTISL